MSDGQPLPILMYATPICRDARRARNRLQELNIPFTEINIKEDESAARYVEQVNNGFRSVPTIVFGDEDFILVEPSVEELDAGLRRAGYQV
jgi:mycoredoxin